MSNQLFAGKSALVTGSTQGLGKAIVERLVSQGLSKVIITGRDQDRGEAVAKNLDCEAYFIAADLEDVQDVMKLAEQAQLLVGPIDHLVNSAAYTGRSTILDDTPEAFDKMFSINVRAPYFLTQSVARQLVQSGRPGSIVNILSISSNGGQPFLSSYCPSKGALATATKNSAFALLRNQIRINGLNIGWMDSAGEAAVQKHWHDAPNDWLETAESQQPLGRLVKPQEVSKVVAFLLGADSSLMTGQVIDFDQQVIGCMETGVHPQAAMVWPPVE